MFLKHKNFVAPCTVIADTSQFVTVIHKLCAHTPSFMVFKREPGATELKPIRKSFQWTLVTIPFGYTNLLSD